MTPPTPATAHIPQPSDICSVCGNGLVHIDSWRDFMPAAETPAPDVSTPLCAFCHHGHTEAAWSDKDPDDGTCWNAGALVCGCPKFITQDVADIRHARLTRAPDR